MAGQILAIKKVYYTFEEAVEKAAEQNFMVDKRKLGIVDAKFSERTNEEGEYYFKTAEDTLADFGENSVPEYPDTEHICVKDWVYKYRY